MYHRHWRRSVLSSPALSSRATGYGAHRKDHRRSRSRVGPRCRVAHERLRPTARPIYRTALATGQMQALFGRLDVPWGEVARVQRGSVDLPANGCDGDPFGVLRNLWLDYSTLETTKQIVANGGDTYVAAVEFGDTARAQVIMTYGNATQPGSPHVG